MNNKKNGLTIGRYTKYSVSDNKCMLIYCDDKFVASIENTTASCDLFYKMATEIDSLNQLTKQSEKIYSQLSRLLLWKTSLKVRVNNQCPTKELVGLEGHVCDLFPDGFTVYLDNPHKDCQFYRFDADYLEVVEWDQKNFSEVLKKLNMENLDGKYVEKK